MSRIYVGNLNFDATEEDIKKFFEGVGEIAAVNIIRNKFNNKSKGFAFVDMPNEEEAKQAVESLNGKELIGRSVVIAEARPQRERDPGERRPNRFDSGPRPSSTYDRRE